MASDGKEPNMVDAPKIGNMDDNMFHQLQKMFGHLELTDREYYDPEEYCHSYKWQGGNPVNVTIQQDA